MRDSGVDISVPRQILPYQSSKELHPTEAVVDKHVSIERGEKYLKNIRNLTTYAGDQPYKNADITIETIDPELIGDKLFLTQTYAQQSRLSNMVEFAQWLRYLGVDLFNLDGKVTVKDDDGKSITSIEPSFFEVDPDGNYRLVCGHHRFLTALLLGEKPKCVTIRNYDEVGSTPFESVPLSKLTIGEGIPSDNQKRTLIPGKSFIDSIDFSPSDTVETRTTPTIFEKRLRFLEMELPSNISESKRQIFADAKKFLGSTFQSPDFLAGIISTSDINSSYPEFGHFEDIMDLGDKYLVTFRLLWSKDDSKGRVYKLLAEKPDVTKRYSTAFLIDPNDSKTLDLIDSTQKISTENYSPLQEKKLISSNYPYYDIYELTLVNQTKLSCVENCSRISRSELLPENINLSGEGSIFVVKIKDQKGKYLLSQSDYRPQIGGTLYQGFSRCFGFNPDRIESNLGISLNKKDFKSSISSLADPSHNGDYSILDIIFLEIDSSKINTHSTQNYVESTTEFGKPTIVDAKDIYHNLRYGKIVDNISQASFFITLIKDNFLELDQNYSEKLIPFSQIYDPLHQQNCLILPDSAKLIGHRIGGLGFSDVGKSWINGMTTIAQPNRLESFSNRHLKTLSVKEIFEMIKDGQFDMETIANLSRVFINTNLVKPNLS